MTEFHGMLRIRLYCLFPFFSTFILVLSSFFLSPLKVAYSAQVTLAWDANTEEDLSGYNVYYGTSSGNYTVSFAAGNWTSCTIADLAEGQTYYFVVTAHDNDGNESDFSNEVSTHIPYTTLAVDFGSQGLFTYDGTTWNRISPMDANGLASYESKIIVSFPSKGIYEYDSSWESVSTSNAEEMIGVGSNVYVDFGPQGLHKYDGSSWQRITASDADGLATYDSKLVANFASLGLWEYDGTWRKMSSDKTCGAMIGIGSSLYVVFSDGLWEYDGASFTLLISWDASALATFDGKLAVNFPGRGLYEYDGSWSRISNNSTAQDMCGVGSILYVDFGGKGLYRYDGANFERISTYDSEEMITAYLP